MKSKNETLRNMLIEKLDNFNKGDLSLDDLKAVSATTRTIIQSAKTDLVYEIAKSKAQTRRLPFFEEK